MADKREKFLKLYADIHEELRRDIVAVIDGKTYSWNIAYIEIKDNTELGKKLLKALEDLGIV